MRYVQTGQMRNNSQGTQRNDRRTLIKERRLTALSNLVLHQSSCHTKLAPLASEYGAIDLYDVRISRSFNTRIVKVYDYPAFR